MEEYSKNFRDYLIVVKKRQASIVLIFFIVLALMVSIAFLLPAVYESKSTILIEQQEIPSDMVATTVTSFASERIRTIQARVMTRTNLLKIIDKYDLYKNERKLKTTEEIVKEMQENVGLDVIGADVVDPKTGRPMTATIAFNLSFRGERPVQVQKVVNELTSLYLNENVSSRTREAADAALFFSDEVARLGKEIDQYEMKLAKFKQNNADSLPELKNLNLQMLQRFESELSSYNSTLNLLNEKKFYLEGQLEQIDPGDSAIPGKAERLAVLEAEYATLSARYSPEHPDVVRLSKEIEGIKGERSEANADSIASDIKALRNELNEMGKKYTADHPDIISVKKRIGALEENLNKILEGKKNPEERYYAEKPGNPAYINLKTQLVATDSEIKSVSKQRETTLEKIKKLEASLYRTPEVEREYLLIRRDYDNAVRHYNEAKIKLTKANIAQELESQSKGERFTLIDPPALPEKPISPNRPAIIFLGFILALACGVGFAFIADMISGTVRGVNGVRRVLGMVPLAVIPYQMNMQELVKSRRVKKRVILLFIIIIMLVLLFIHTVISPLDVLWFRIARKTEMMSL